MVFLFGFLVGFLACAWLCATLLTQKGLVTKDGTIINLREVLEESDETPVP